MEINVHRTQKCVICPLNKTYCSTEIIIPEGVIKEARIGSHIFKMCHIGKGILHEQEDQAAKKHNEEGYFWSRK